MHYRPQDGTWVLGSQAAEIHRLKKEMDPKDYEADKLALKEFLCGYFSTSDCNTAQGSSISPLGATKKGGKILKVRWAYPGCGKSGSMRLVVVAYCDDKKVHIAGAFSRRSDPSDDEIFGAVDDDA